MAAVSVQALFTQDFGDTQDTIPAFVTSNYLTLLGLGPALGRGFTSDDASTCVGGMPHELSFDEIKSIIVDDDRAIGAGSSRILSYSCGRPVAGDSGVQMARRRH